MGLLDKLIKGVNRAAAPVEDALILQDDRMERAAEVAARGVEASGRIVGIRRRSVDSTTQTVFTIDVVGSPTAGAQRVATEVTTTPHLHHLRLGVAVPMRVDGRHGVIDWDVLARTLGLSGPAPGQRLHEKPPDDGIVDDALDARVQRRLERGRRASAAITSLDRVVALGMPTLNWDLRLELADGAAATCPKDEVPPYAWWAAYPGAEVPIAVDDRDASIVAVDWPAVAVAVANTAGLDQRPPAGSIADMMDTAAAPEARPVAGAGGADGREIVSANRDVAQVQGTLRAWLGEVHAGRMKPKAFLKSVAEWEAAGLCTPEEAAAARAEAGLAG